MEHHRHGGGDQQPLEEGAPQVAPRPGSLARYRRTPVDLTLLDSLGLVGVRGEEPRLARTMSSYSARSGVVG